MKKVIAILLAAVMIFGLAACTSSQEPAASTTPAPSTTPAQPATPSPASSSTPSNTEPASNVDTSNFYYGKTITLMIPFSAGGSADMFARELASLTEEILGCTFAINNITGGGGLVGFNALIGATNDGFSLGCVSPSMLLYKHTKKADVSYDSADILFLGQLLDACVVVGKDSQFNTINELVDYAKAHPGELRYGNSGIGAIYHVLMENMSRKCGISCTPVPYDSGINALAAAAGGHVEFAVCGLNEAAAMIDSGDLKPLCIMGDNPNKKYPDIQTTTDAGYPGLLGAWNGIAAPKGIPDEAKETLVNAFIEAVNSDEFTAYLDNLGNSYLCLYGDELYSFLAEENDAFAEICAGM